MTGSEAPSRLGGGRYEVGEQIGTGGLATVWRCVDTRLGVERAVKILPPRGTARSARARFEQEARVMALLEHPHVVPVHDVGEDDGRLWMVMSLYRNGSVADRVERDGPLPAGEAVPIVDGVLQALAAAHAHGIVHRDVKPHNVLIDDQGAARLGDFGIARVGEAAVTRTGAVLGTIAFMAPEQRVDTKAVGPPADIYAVGTLLVSIVTGELPGELFHRPALDELAPRLPPELLEFVRRCTEFAPDQRYASAEEARVALRAIDPTLRGPLPVAPRPAIAVDSSTLGSEHWSDDPPVRPRVRALTVLAASAGTLSVGCGGLALGAVVLAALTSLPGADSPEPAPPQGEVAPAAPQPVPAPVPAPADPAPELPRPVPSTGPAPAVESPRPRPAAPAPTEPAPSPPAVPVHVSSVPSAPLEIDDVARGNTPWDGELEPGEHWLVIREDGKLRLRRKIAIGPGPLVAYCWDLATEEPCSH